MYLDAELYSPRTIPLKSAQAFVLKKLPRMGWGATGGAEVVLDVGCGPGGTTKNLILPLFSRTSKIFAFDAVPDMIALANKQNFSPQIEYSVANMENWSSVERWKKQITKLVSICVFQWLKDQRRAFHNVYHLLQKGGQAAFFFPLQSSFFVSLIEIQKSTKWNQYINGVEIYVPESQYEGYDASYYKNMLEELGFEVLYCKSGEKIDVYPSKEEFRDFFTSICVLRKHVPADQLEEFENDFMQIMYQNSGQTIDGIPFHKGNLIELVIRKK